jgi:carboxymethylenebutenolidase
MSSSPASGFARAVSPVSAQTIATDTLGLEAGAISIPTTDGQIPGYRAMPKSGKSFPVVLVVQEIFGVHEHIQDVCRRFAKLGHMAIAPELYIRQGDVSKITEIQQIVTQVVSKVPDAQVMSDLDAAVNWATKSGRGDIRRLGITGFCWGGRIVWLYAAHSAKLKAGVAWYGRVVGQTSELQPKYPIDVAGALHAPVLGLYGGQDASIPLETVEQMRETLQAARSPSEIHVYPDAGHAFNADYRPSYNKAAAQDGWDRLEQWFKKHGAA